MFWRKHWGAVLMALLALPLLSASGFWLWLSHRPDVTLKSGAECWDVFLKFVSAMTVIFGGAMVFGKYIEERADAAAVDAQHAERDLALREAEFLRQKLAIDAQHHADKVKLLTEARSVAARIATAPEPDSGSLVRLDELYYADLIGVEKFQGPVEEAMVQFRLRLKNDPRAGDKSLEELSLRLSDAVDDEMKESEADLLRQHRAIASLLPSRE